MQENEPVWATSNNPLTFTTFCGCLRRRCVQMFGVWNCFIRIHISISSRTTGRAVQIQINARIGHRRVCWNLSLYGYERKWEFKIKRIQRFGSGSDSSTFSSSVWVFADLRSGATMTGIGFRFSVKNKFIT